MTKKRRTSARPMDWRIAVLLLILVLIISLIQEFEGGDTPSTSIEPTVTPMTGSTAVPNANQALMMYTNTAELVYPDVPAERQPPQFYQAFLADIAAATQSVDIAVFDLDLPELTEALVAAQQRGVTVRVAFDDENLENAKVATAIGALEDAGVQVVSDQREPFMHQKIGVFDKQIVWTGSWNMTFNDTYRNNNNMLRIENPAMAADYTREVDQFMAGDFGTRKTGYAPFETVPLPDGSLDYYFSPKDKSNALIVEAINQAQTQVRFMAFSYTDDAIGQAMIAAHERGLSVAGVMERQNVRGTGSEFAILADGGVDILADGNCYIMHHKTMIIDDDVVITGSYNFTKSAEQSNDENLLIIRSPQLAAQYLAEYDRVRNQAENPLTCGR
jgi:phosphatidylserine/phosphatidylglycerophosphate/cardiolipin synthase-like enzyme